MKQITLFFVIGFFSCAYGFGDFKTGYEYKFTFELGGKDGPIVETPDAHNLHEGSIKGTLILTKSDGWYHGRIIKSSINSVHPEYTEMNSGIEKPFKFNETYVDDADDVARGAKDAKNIIMGVIFHDFEPFNKLLTQKTIDTGMRLELPMMNWCKFTYEKQVDGEKIIATIKAKSPDCTETEHPTGEEKKYARVDTLKMDLEYNAADSTLKTVKIYFKSPQVIDEKGVLWMRHIWYNVNFVGSDVLTF